MIIAFKPYDSRKIYSGILYEDLAINLNYAYYNLLLSFGLYEREAKIKAGREAPSNPMKLIRRGIKIIDVINVVKDNIEELINIDGVAYQLNEVQLKAPIPNPSKIICVGLNYMDHIIEAGMKIPEEPLLFAKAPSSITGPYDPIKIPKISNKIDYEAELAIVIGAKCKNVREDEALNYVLGFMAANDVTARDLEFKDPMRLFWSKSFDTFCPIGPGIALPSEVGDPDNLRIICRVNGEVMQNSNTGNMIFNVNRLISFISMDMTLYPGDIILTGTPSGVGFKRNPPRYLRRGDIVEVEIEKIGVIKNRVV